MPREGLVIERVETLSENWYPLRRVHATQRRRDGSRQAIAREVYENGEGAAVLPCDAARGTVLLVRQLRLPALLAGDPDPALVEACAGMVETGQSPEGTARAEAEQELGCRLSGLRRVFTVFTSPGCCAERLHGFLAAYDEAARTGPGGGLRQEGEEIEVLELPLDEAWRMVLTGAIRDAKTVLLIQHLLIERRG